jgi:hypothetical protein
MASWMWSLAAVLLAVGGKSRCAVEATRRGDYTLTFRMRVRQHKARGISQPLAPLAQASVLALISCRLYRRAFSGADYCRPCRDGPP